MRQITFSLNSNVRMYSGRCCRTKQKKTAQSTYGELSTWNIILLHDGEKKTSRKTWNTIFLHDGEKKLSRTPIEKMRRSSDDFDTNFEMGLTVRIVSWTFASWKVLCRDCQGRYLIRLYLYCTTLLRVRDCDPVNESPCLDVGFDFLPIIQSRLIDLGLSRAKWQNKIWSRFREFENCQNVWNDS